MDFYDEIAENYDAITSATQRAAAAEGFLKGLLSRYTVRSVLDVACGTGMYAIGLARMGVRVVGVDLSQGMLDQAARLSEQAGVSVQWVAAGMAELAPSVSDSFDAVICMGNSVPHLLDDEDLAATMEGFARMARPGGVIVLQLLNYTKVLRQAQRVVGIDKQGPMVYVRFYDFMGDRLQFNILEIDTAGGDCPHKLHTTVLRPYIWSDLERALRSVGCASVQLFGGLQFAPFDQERSETVMLVAQR